jgi:hypothetical protein
MAIFTFCSVKQMAHLLNLTEQRVQQFAASGLLIKNQRGEYEVFSSTRAYIRFLKRQIQRAQVIAFETRGREPTTVPCDASSAPKTAENDALANRRSALLFRLARIIERL